MKTLARERSESGAASDEVQKLREVLDRSYALMRERASREWHRRCVDPDPSDACVNVHIGHSRQDTIAA